MGNFHLRNWQKMLGPGATPHRAGSIDLPAGVFVGGRELARGDVREGGRTVPKCARRYRRWSWRQDSGAAFTDGGPVGGVTIIKVFHIQELFDAVIDRETQ
jgi:hypothetical protein